MSHVLALHKIALHKIALQKIAKSEGPARPGSTIVGS
jgi:hypothetical protein